MERNTIFDQIDAQLKGLQARFEDRAVATDQRITRQILDLDRMITMLVEACEQKLTIMIGETDRRAEARANGLAALVESQRHAADEAVAKAETATEKRFDSVNGFRDQLGDIVARTMPRAEAEAAIKALQDRYDATVGALSERFASNAARLDRAEGQQVASARFLAAALSVGAIVVTIVFGLLAFVAHRDDSASIAVATPLTVAPAIVH